MIQQTMPGLAFNPQLLAGDFDVLTDTVPVNAGESVEIVGADPNRILLMLQAHDVGLVANIKMPTGPSDGFQLIPGQGPVTLHYKRDGAVVGYAWFAYNGDMFMPSSCYYLTSSYKPRRM